MEDGFSTTGIRLVPTGLEKPTSNIQQAATTSGSAGAARRSEVAQSKVPQKKKGRRRCSPALKLGTLCPMLSVYPRSRGRRWGPSQPRPEEHFLEPRPLVCPSCAARNASRRSEDKLLQARCGKRPIRWLTAAVQWLSLAFRRAHRRQRNSNSKLLLVRLAHR